MPIQQYRYLIEIHQGERELVDQAPASVDFSAALEWTWLAGIQRNDLELTDGTRSSAVVPVWHPDFDRPYIAGFRVTILAERLAGITEEFSTDYFSDLANAATRRLLEEGRLSTREGVRFLALAFFNEAHAEAQAGPTPPFSIREAPPDLTLGQSRLADFTADSTRVSVSTEEADGEGVPIVIPRRVLDETRDATLRAADRETGGILIGHLHRDAERSKLFVEVTAQIPVVHAPAEVNKLTFTPETWTAVQAAVDLRRSNEILVGPWHSHPVLEWCKDCPQEKKDVCPLAQGFMSADDCQLHRTVFPRAYTCSLVVSNIAEDRDVVQTLFGWRRGVIEQKGYYVVDHARRGAKDNVAIPDPERKANTKPSGGK